MVKGPLVGDQIEAGAKLLRDFDTQYLPLRAAFWLKETEESQWYLYLVPDQIDTSGVGSAYEAVIRLLGPGPHLWLRSFDVKVVPSSHPVARGVIEAQQKYGKFATRLYGMLGGRSIEEAFLYPPMHVRSEPVIAS